MRRFVAGIFLFSMAASVSGEDKTASTQEAVPAFPAKVEQVTVDAAVLDKKGKPVEDLVKGDFTILEDGVPQAVTYFEAVKLPEKPLEKPPVKPRVATNTDPVTRAGRTFVFIFDDIHTSRANGERAKTAIAEFLKKAVREGDRVSLVAVGGNAWWTARMEEGREEVLGVLKRLEGHYVPDTSAERMTEWEAMRIQVYNDQDVSNRVIRRFINSGVMDSSFSAANVMSTTNDPDPTHVGMHNPIVDGKAAEVYSKELERLHLTLGVLKRVLDSLASSKGRKAVILVSDGFIMDSTVGDFKDVVRSSRQANAAIYSVDSIGLSSMPTDLTAESAAPQVDMDVGSAFLDASLADEGNENLARDTGGFSLKNMNDLGPGIERIGNESLAYYLIGYTPTNAKQDGKFRKIEVKVDKTDVQVRARKGYYAPGDTSAPGKKKEPPVKDPQFQLALDSPYESDDIPLRMTAYVVGESIVGKAKTAVVSEVDLKTFSFKEEGGRFSDTVEFMMVAAQRQTGEFWRYDQKETLDLLPATRDRYLKTWLPLSREFELPTGDYQVKLVVRDKNSGKIGTVTYDFEVPDLSSFRLSTVALADRLRESPDDPSKTLNVPALMARRTFPEGTETLYALFSVFGASKDAESGAPKVTAGYQIRGADGSVKTDAPPSFMRPTSLGKLGRGFGTSLAGLPPGDYELVLTVKDEVAGKTLEDHEPFTIVPVQAAGQASP